MKGQDASFLPFCAGFPCALVLNLSGGALLQCKVMLRSTLREPLLVELVEVEFEELPAAAVEVL